VVAPKEVCTVGTRGKVQFLWENGDPRIRRNNSPGTQDLLFLREQDSYNFSGRRPVFSVQRKNKKNMVLLIGAAALIFY